MRLRLRADVPVACYLSGGSTRARCSASRRGFAEPAPRLHAVVRPRRLRRERARRGAGGAVGRRVLPRSRSARTTSRDHFSDAIYHAERPFVNAHAVAKYPAEPGRPRLRHQGGADGRGQRRDLRRLSALPARPACCTTATGRTPSDAQRCSRELEAANRVSAGMLMPDGERRRSTACSACSASCRRAWRPGADRRRPACAVADDDFRASVRRSRHVPRRCSSRLDVERPARRARRREPVALHLGQDRAAELHPQQPGRSHGDGALGRGPAAVPRSPRRRGGGADAGAR